MYRTITIIVSIYITLIWIAGVSPLGSRFMRLPPLERTLIALALFVPLAATIIITHLALD